MKSLLVGVFTLYASTAYAAPFNGNDIFEACTSNPSLVYGYVSGFSDKAQEDENILMSSGFTKGFSFEMKDEDLKLEKAQKRILGFCIPSGVALGQVKDAVCNHLKNTPASRHSLIAPIVHEALILAWPCR
jgi:hypothetical protein